MIRTSSDYKTGFGGQFGVQTDRVDKNAVGWEHNEKVGNLQFVVEQEWLWLNNVVGWEHNEKVGNLQFVEWLWFYTMLLDGSTMKRVCNEL